MGGREGRRASFWRVVALVGGLLSVLVALGCAEVTTQEAESGRLLGAASLYEDPAASGGHRSRTLMLPAE